ncbi:MAG: hypothetical protein EPN21_04290 [Methylococcaceae bacterium]|nr:MAG: hypothetical protein EPN21_04290 [Methylococcaceae bacterium]
MTPIFRAYLGVALGLMLVFAGMLAAFNRFMDPFDYYWSPTVPGINAVKVKARRYERYVKPDILQRLRPATVILGNSIAEIGFDPEGPALRERQAYNDGLLGAQWPLIQCHALYALGLPATRHIILGLKLEAMPAVDCDRPENAVQHASLRQRLFSTEALSASVTTLINQDRPSMRKHTGLILGWRGKAGPERRFSQALRQAGCGSAATPPAAVGDLSGLESILRSARQRGVRVDLFFYPHHAYFMETQLACPGRQLWALMENAAQRVAGMNHDGLFALWSFYEYNAYTTERVTQAPMQYWQDLTHFNWEYGEAVLEQMFAPAATPAIGVRLAPETMEETRQRFAAGREQSHREHPEMYEDLRRMLAQRSAR